MARRCLTILFLVALLAGACTIEGSAGSSTTAPPRSEAEGRIVILDDNGNVVVLNPDGSNRIEITNDGDSVRYFQPIFSPASQTIAWSEGRPDGFGVGIANEDGTDRFSVELGSFPFYLNWSPDGRRIGLLHNGSSGGVDMEILDAGDRQSGLHDNGTPYYFSWSPDGDAFVVHADGTRLEIFDESAGPTDLGATRSEYLAPHWTAAGIFYVAPDGVALRQTSDSEPEVLADVEGFVNLYPNSQGTRVALHPIVDVAPEMEVGLTVQQQQIEPNLVSVVEVATGEVRPASDAPSIGSFWSPDGDRLLMLVLTPADGEFDVAVWEDGDTRILARIELPVSLIGEALQFSDQYAESWQMWSPGSDAVVLPGTVDGESGIWIVPIDGAPSKLADGEWAAWSHG